MTADMAATVLNAAMHNDIDVLQRNLDGLDPDDDDVRSYKDCNGRTALHWAAANGHDGAVEALIRHRWDVNVDDEVHWTPLHSACSAGHVPVVRQLLQQKANCHARNDNGCTPIMYAASKGNTLIVDLLLKNGANPSISDASGQCPLHRAASRGKADIVEMLVRDPRVNINAVDNAGHSALHLACMEGDKEMAADLIDLGADARLRDKDGKVAFHYAPSAQVNYLVSLVLDKDKRQDGAPAAE
ncbi:hypothetical protein PBRA_001009 [Plasmodiophora brassicae]|nr:hypothetical protein PBRA_001009 [Plasmodiophora brassicae]